MAKAGMRRPDNNKQPKTESNKKMHFEKNEQQPVQEFQGQAKAGHEKAKGIGLS